MDSECRDCQAGVAQAAQMDAAFRCSTHGVVRVPLVLEAELDKVRAERDRARQDLALGRQWRAAIYQAAKRSRAEVKRLRAEIAILRTREATETELNQRRQGPWVEEAKHGR